MKFSALFQRLKVAGTLALLVSLLQSGGAFAAGTTLRVTPGSLSFGAEVFGVSGATSKAKTVTISNPKSAAQPATIATLSLGGADPGNFAVEDPNGCKGTALPPGKKCTVEVTFTPTKLGALSGTLTVTDSGGHSATPVGLKGSGVPGALQFKPHTLSFPKTQRGTFSAPQQVALTNNNPVALEISNVTAGGAFMAKNSCPETLAAGVSCQVSVIFSPPAAKNSNASKLTGALMMADDATASPQRVQLSGIAFGTAPTPTPTPTATPTPSPTPTPTPTPTQAARPTPTPTPTPTATPTPTPTPTATATPCTSGICGQVLGGLTPIANSSVTLYAAGTSGYGSAATPIGTATTNADGTFTVASYTCPAGNPQTYITASGGNAGLGANPAIGLMAALGPCNSLSTSTNVTINELTTAAAAWALAQFFDSSGHTIGAPFTNTIGLINAYAGLANLADANAGNLSVSGDPSPFLPSASACASRSPPANCDGLQRLNTVANILAGCVESSGASSSVCAALMCDATPGGLTYSSSCSGTPTITDTMGAAYLIVSTSPHNVGALYGLAGTAPFSPTLAAAPDGWEMGLNFAPAGAAFEEPVSIALDALGNVFVANSGNGSSNLGSVSELTVASSYTTGLNFAPSGAAFAFPYSLALDGPGNVFVTNATGNGGSVSELTASSSYATGLNFGPSGAPVSLALDGSGNVFVANLGNVYFDATLLSWVGTPGSVSELTASSSYATRLNFGSGGGEFDAPVSLTLDGSGNVFVASKDGPVPGILGSVTELTAGSGYFTEYNLLSDYYLGANPYTFPLVPTSMALDGSGNVWVAYLQPGVGNGALIRLPGYNAAGDEIETSPSGAALDIPESIALDGSSNVFAANYDGNSVSEVTAASSYTTGLNFAPSGAALSYPYSLASDGSGNVWLANRNGNSVSELLGLSKPVIVPVQGCLIYWSNHPGQACVP